MAIRKLFFVLALAVMALPGFVIAQHQHRATVLLRNGDRVSGNLDDVENGSVYVRVSQNDQRKIPVGEVLLIDLVGGASGLPETELSVAARADHLVVLRNGSSWTGQFVDVRGGEANANQNENHSLIFRTGGEERRVDLDQVGRIYFGNYPFNTTVNNTPTAPTNVPAGAVRVPGNATWVPTGIVVRRGDRLTFNVNGQIQLSDDGGDIATAGGSHKGRRAPGSPLPADLAGALIGKVGNSAPFGIGDQSAAITMPLRGELFLGVNDDHVNDNRGEFVVQIQNLGATRQ
jgi:hypothetical protein